MSGLEKILSEICSGAEVEAGAVLEKARAEAAGVLAEYRAQGARAADQIGKQASVEAASIEASAQSEAALRRRHGLLEAKQALLARTLDAAMAALRALPPADYFSFLLEIAASNAEQGQGVLLLSRADLARLPGDFGERLAVRLPRGAALSLSPEGAELDGGCILRYGKMDKNCSFAAIFDARRDEFMDRARDILFA